MKLQVLISCMHQKDHSIIERSNIQSDVIVINQCDVDNREEWTFRNKKGEECNALFISTTERGLSRSRNLAIANASADICLICDDDEVFDDEYCRTIIGAHQKYPNFDIITFNLNDRYRKFPLVKQKLTFITALKSASWQISFKRVGVIDKHIKFDVGMGAGATMGGSEENKFLLDCLRNKLKGTYLPVIIGSVSQASSTWEVTLDNCERYFIDRGAAYHKLMGKWLGGLYVLYSSVKKRKDYVKFMPLMKSISLQFKGLCNESKS